MPRVDLVTLSGTTTSCVFNDLATLTLGQVRERFSTSLRTPPGAIPPPRTPSGRFSLPGTPGGPGPAGFKGVALLHKGVELTPDQDDSLLMDLLSLPSSCESCVLQADGPCVASEMQGRRPGYMEDRHVAHLLSPSAWGFAVFDGHGGEACADFLRRNFFQQLARTRPHDLVSEDALIATFRCVDEDYKQFSGDLGDKARPDGSTASVLILHKEEDAHKFVFAMVGDSRGIRCGVDGRAVVLVRDHHLSRREERERVEAKGGLVLEESEDCFRVIGSNGSGLAMTRAIGDYAFKPFVDATPEIVSGNLDETDAYFFVASDGVWGDVTEGEVARVLTKKGHLSPCCFQTPWLIDGATHRKEDGEEEGSPPSSSGETCGCACVCESCWSASSGAPHPSPADFPFNAWSLRDRTDHILETAFERGSDDNLTGIAIDVRKCEAGLVDARASPSRPESRMSGSFFFRETGSKYGLPMESPNEFSLTSPQEEPVRDVEIPLFSVMITNDLLLWRDPSVSLLWFLAGEAFFACVVFMEWPALTLVALGIAFRLVFNFAFVRLARLVKRVAVVESLGARLETYFERHQIVSEQTIQHMSSGVLGLVMTLVMEWINIVTKGSTTKVLMALRTVTYLYTPVPIVVLTWGAFTGLFLGPAIYTRYKEAIDARHARLMAEWETRVASRVKAKWRSLASKAG